MKLPEKCPTCLECSGYIRPDFVLFTESLPGDEWSNAYRAVSNADEGDVMLIIGTSAVVYPAAELPEIASRSNVKIIEINLQSTSYSTLENYSFIEGKAGEILPIILEEIKSQSSL